MSVHEQVWLVVLRLQLCEPVLVALAQDPLAQRYAVTVRVCVPVLSQVLVYPPQALQGP